MHWNHEYVGKDYRAETGFVPRIQYYNSETKEYIYRSYWRFEPSFEYSFYPGNDDISVSFPASGNALIRCVIDDGAYISLFAPFAPGHPFSNPIFSDSFDFDKRCSDFCHFLFSYLFGKYRLSSFCPVIKKSFEAFISQRMIV